MQEGTGLGQHMMECGVLAVNLGGGGEGAAKAMDC